MESINSISTCKFSSKIKEEKNYSLQSHFCENAIDRGQYDHFEKYAGVENTI